MPVNPLTGIGIKGYTPSTLYLKQNTMQETTTQQKTSVATLIGIVVVGGGLTAALLFFSRTDQAAETTTTTQKAVILSLDVKDVLDVTAQVGSMPAGVTPKPVDINLHPTNTAVPFFGMYTGSEYNHGNTSATPQPLALTFAYKPDRDLLLGIKATLEIGEGIYTICVPADTETNTQTSPGGVNINANGNTNSVNPLDNITYYPDLDGNLYRDANFTQKVSSIRCQDIINRAFIPNTVTGLATTPVYNYGPGQWLYVLKLLKYGGAYNKLDGFQSVGTDTTGWKIPAIVFHVHKVTEGEPNVALAFPTTKVVVQSNLGKTTLCVPEKVLQPDENFFAFYDKTGMPYSDVFLQQPITCSFNTNICSSVRCDKDPLNPCCVKPLAIPAN
jgi:hypothetical protein